MGDIETSTVVTARTAGAREMPDVGAGTLEYFPTGAGATISVEARVDRNFSVGTGITAV